MTDTDRNWGIFKWRNTVEENDFAVSDWNSAWQERGESALVFPLIEFLTLKELSFKIALAES